VPDATLAKGKGKSLEAWNLVLDGDEAKFVPWMAAPTDSFGFGEIKPPDAARTQKGSVTAADAQIDEPIAELELVDSSLDKDRIEIVLRAGKQTLTVAIDVPPDGK
jgi:Flp pilus assembly protein CpaB